MVYKQNIKLDITLRMLEESSPNLVEQFGLKNWSLLILSIWEYLVSRKSNSFRLCDLYMG